MVPVDWLLSLILGTLLPLAAANVYWERRPLQPLDKARSDLLLWAGVVFAPISTFVLTWQPAWGFMYLFDPTAHRVIASVLYGVSSALIVGSAVLGFDLSNRWIKAHQRNRSLWLIFGTLASMLILAAANARRGLAVGTYDDWVRGSTQSFFSHPLLPVNLVVIPLILVLYFKLFFRLGRATHTVPLDFPKPVEASP